MEDIKVTLEIKCFKNDIEISNNHIEYNGIGAYKYLVNSLIMHINRPRFMKMHSRYDSKGKHVIVGEFTRNINDNIKYVHNFEVTGEEVSGFDLL